MALSRSTNRRLPRPTTRMLGGARRPRPVNQIALICRAMAEVIRIDRHLKPWLEEQARLAAQRRWMETWEPALLKVYGPRSDSQRSTINPQPRVDSQPSTPNSQLSMQREVLKRECALAKTRALLAHMKAKLARNR